MDRFVCIHGHFYQPPRENPWLEAIELQESAFPYHDWNDRITDECYAANARSRILDGEGRILDIASNYERISFNFGPTLLSWLEQERPAVYREIIDSDRRSVERFGGHGSAIAQGYGHIILPLSNDRDRRTQVLWGVRDFQRRFGRDPEGMWCPETAVNTATLEALAEHGIRFTILAPRQAARVRRLGGRSKWKDVHEKIDPSRAYLCRLPSGRDINLFFYDGPVSQGVAFERLLESGEKFAGRLMEIFDGSRDWPQLAHIATDGETYGHHHRHGDMALAYALHHIEAGNLARLTNYAQFLSLHPPTHEVEIVEDSSWSCIHGVERWRSNCGCSSGRPGWHQQWRAPLRAALDWLRDTLAPRFEQEAAALLRDPWGARDGYIDVVLDRSDESTAGFLERHAVGGLDGPARRRAIKLLEMQRHLMLMYTSCGWFFDELSGIETVQVTQYAGRAMQLAKQALGDDLEPGFMERLEQAPSNLPERPNGRRIYEDFVRPAFVDLRKVGAHYAVSSVFEDYPEEADVYAYRVHRTRSEVLTAGRASLVVGRAQVASRITGDAEDLTFAVFHMGDHVLNAGVRPFGGDEAFTTLLADASAAFSTADYTVLLGTIAEAFGDDTYTLRDLFKDEQRRVVDRILESTLSDIHNTYRQIYESHAPLLRFLTSLRLPPPPALRVNAEYVLNLDIRAALGEEPPDMDRIRTARREADEQSIAFDPVTLAFSLETALARESDRLAAAPRDPDAVRRLSALVQLAVELPFEVNLATAQNAYFPVMRAELPRARAEHTPEDNPWLSAFIELGRRLHVKVD